MKYYQEEISEKIKNFCKEVPVCKYHKNEISSKVHGRNKTFKCTEKVDVCLIIEHTTKHQCLETDLVW